MMDASSLKLSITRELPHRDADRCSVPRSGRDLLPSVWDKSAPALARLVCALGIESGRAEDILQDVYLTAWRKCPQHVGQDELKRWVFRVAVNRCNLEHRRRSWWKKIRNGLTRFAGNSSGESDPADQAERVEEQELIRQCLETLEPRLRTVLVLRFFAEFDSQEIGKMLDLPDLTVRSQLRKARQQLARELKRAGYRDA